MRVANFWIFALLCCTNGSYLVGIWTKNSILIKNDFQNSWVYPWGQPGAGVGAARDAILSYVKHRVMFGFSIVSVVNFGSFLFMMHKWCLSHGIFNQELNFDEEWLLELHNLPFECTRGVVSGAILSWLQYRIVGFFLMNCPTRKSFLLSKIFLLASCFMVLPLGST